MNVPSSILQLRLDPLADDRPIPAAGVREPRETQPRQHEVDLRQSLRAVDTPRGIIDQVVARTLRAVRRVALPVDLKMAVVRMDDRFAELDVDIVDESAGNDDRGRRPARSRPARLRSALRWRSTLSSASRSGASTATPSAASKTARVGPARVSERAAAHPPPEGATHAARAAGRRSRGDRRADGSHHQPVETATPASNPWLMPGGAGIGIPTAFNATASASPTRRPSRLPSHPEQRTLAGK